MFYKIVLSTHPMESDFHFGNGFYFISYPSSTLADEVWYFNENNKMMICIEVGDNIYDDLKNIFEYKEPVSNERVVVLEKENTSNISEDLFLKAIALARMNVSDIKFNEILK